jgi:hypothetical protein
MWDVLPLAVTMFFTYQWKFCGSTRARQTPTMAHYGCRNGCVNGETIPEVKPLAFWGVAKRSRLVIRCYRDSGFTVDDLGPDAALDRKFAWSKLHVTLDPVRILGCQW